MKRGETLAKAVLNKRINKNLSMTQAARQIGISYVAYWKIESNGYTNLRYDTISKIAKFLEITEVQVRELL